MTAVETRKLSKIYSSNFGKRKVNALQGLDLAVEPGTIFGLLGPNGAGKTTLIKILLGITHPTEGNAKILNEDISNYEVKKRVGYLPENHKYPPYLTGENVLKFFGKLSGCDSAQLDKKADYLMDMVKLEKWKKVKVKNYSKGMMQRLGLAQSIINDPDLIFLDEPTDGVDPIGRKEIRDMLLELKDKGKTIFLNSHLLSEVEMITDRVAILNKGIMLRQGTVKELTEKKQEYRFIFEGIDAPEFAKKLLPENGGLIDKDNSVKINVHDTDELNRFIDLFRSNNLLISSIIPQKESLESIFIDLINKSEGKQN